jgi:hypothetical protein
MDHPVEAGDDSAVRHAPEITSPSAYFLGILPENHNVEPLVVFPRPADVDCI